PYNKCVAVVHVVVPTTLTRERFLIGYVTSTARVVVVVIVVVPIALIRETFLTGYVTSPSLSL
ncbi:hypothetical protein L7F22_066334, partial [Adiantum nelumboides]|nr:hypothetical protein [Adiantum nelumboides]